MRGPRWLLAADRLAESNLSLLVLLVLLVVVVVLAVRHRLVHRRLARRVAQLEERLNQTGEVPLSVGAVEPAVVRARWQRVLGLLQALRRWVLAGAGRPEGEPPAVRRGTGEGP